MASSFLTTICLFTFALRLETTPAVDEDEMCPTWYVFNSTSKKCFCPDLDESWVVCDQFTHKAYLARGLCMTFDNRTGNTDVGKCPYTIFDKQHEAPQGNGYIELPENVSDLNEFMCGLWNREGYLCSKCKDGYGIAISNVFMKCVKCDFNNGEGWLFYLMLQIIPVIVLFLTLLVFRVSVVKPPMNAYVTFCQLALGTLFTNAYRFHAPFVNDCSALKQAHYLSLVSIGIWAMSLTEQIHGIGLNDFCVDHNINIQQTFTLTQIKSLFPLLLIAFTYICIKLYSRNCRLILWLWKPFQSCFACYTQIWNPKLSLVDVFSTFLLLLSSRYVIVLYFMYSFQHTYRSSSGWNDTASLLYNPAVPYFHPSNHLPYALVLLFTPLTVAIPPALLLAFYQIRLFQKIMTCVCLHRSFTIHIFVDLFQGCCKDVLNGTYDLRFTASLYMLVRIVMILSYIGCNNTTFANCDTLLVFIWVFSLLLFFTLVRPYTRTST